MMLRCQASYSREFFFFFFSFFFFFFSIRLTDPISGNSIDAKRKKKKKKKKRGMVLALGKGLPQISALVSEALSP